MTDIKTIEEVAGEFFMPMTGYMNLRRQEAKVRLKCQIVEGYQDGLNQDEIFEIAIQVCEEASQDLKCECP